MKALIIQGPQGSGKSTLARELAAGQGRGVYDVIDAAVAESSYFELSDSLRHNLDTLILEEFNHEDGKQLAMVKQLVSNDRVEVSCKNVESYVVDTPNLIMVSGAAEPIKFDVLDRRFAVIYTSSKEVEA
jgi:serine kinase of HPr protein (carbohydrate metabolism regulator)